MTTDTTLASSLRDRLGSETVGQWLLVMDEIASRLPFLLGSAGRPTAESIERSPIGEAGFGSWRNMVEAAPAEGGLGWSFESYKSWKRAYVIVQSNPYLRDLAMSASEINTIARESDPEPFPASPETLAAFREGRSARLDEKRGNSIKALQGQLDAANARETALRSDLSASQALVEQLQKINAGLTGDLATANEKVGSFEVISKNLEDTKTALKASENQRETAVGNAKNRRRKVEELTLELNALKARSPWQLLWSAVKGKGA